MGTALRRGKHTPNDERYGDQGEGHLDDGHKCRLISSAAEHQLCGACDDNDGPWDDSPTCDSSIIKPTRSGGGYRERQAREQSDIADRDAPGRADTAEAK